VRSTTVTVGGNAAINDEYTPAVMAPRGDGSAWLAWTDKTSQSIRMASLTNADTLGASLPGLTGLEVHAMLATPSGAALAVMANDPDIYSAKYCQSGATPGNAVCGKLDLVRLDLNGSVLSRTTLTKKGNVDSVGAQFIWWYGHTARLASDGSAIGVYFRSAMSTQRPGVAGEVDIHAGDTLKFVDGATGSLLGGGWDWGCSHSWSVRLAHNGTQWAASCHGDAYPNAMQLARLSGRTATPASLQWLGGSDPTQRALGGLVPVSGGHWVNYVEPVNGAPVLKLAKVPESGNAWPTASTIAAATGIDSGYPFRPYMASYGTGKLLLGWKSAGRLMLAVADASSGAVLEGPVSTTLPIDQFQEMTTTPAGDVVWAYSPGGSTLRVQRVAACKLVAP
jgi:hypothetical protein